MQAATTGAGRSTRAHPGPPSDDYPRWPAALTLLLSAVGLGVAAAIRQPLWSAIAYGTLLVVGAVLLAVQRHLAIVNLRPPAGRHRALNPWARGSAPLSLMERVAVVGLLLAALANAWVVALEIGRWAWVQ